MLNFNQNMIHGSDPSKLYPSIIVLYVRTRTRVSVLGCSYRYAHFRTFLDETDGCDDMDAAEAVLNLTQTELV